jgi:hypothetical protein
MFKFISCIDTVDRSVDKSDAKAAGSSGMLKQSGVYTKPGYTPARPFSRYYQYMHLYLCTTTYVHYSILLVC